MKHLFQSIEKYYNIVLGIPGRTVATTTTTTATNTATATGSTTTGSTTTGSTTTASTTTSNTEPVTQTTTGSDRVNSVLIEKAMKLQERAQQLQETHVHNPDVSRSEILWGSLSKLFQVQFCCNFLVSRWIRKWTKRLCHSMHCCFGEYPSCIRFNIVVIQMFSFIESRRWTYFLHFDTCYKIIKVFNASSISF